MILYNAGQLIHYSGSADINLENFTINLVAGEYVLVVFEWAYSQESATGTTCFDVTITN